ncbi:hypothetical protein [Nocardiopsis salina]|uniref:hypothetical protein n=1 Tax=Nocardiopsis salina TaxID=245836 RepID=UPI0003478D53|nr:hypothetical protein [Nocardiopsis salina]
MSAVALVGLIANQIALHVGSEQEMRDAGAAEYGVEFAELSVASGPGFWVMALMLAGALAWSIADLVLDRRAQGPLGHFRPSGPGGPGGPGGPLPGFGGPGPDGGPSGPGQLSGPGYGPPPGAGGFPRAGGGPGPQGPQVPNAGQQSPYPGPQVPHTGPRDPNPGPGGPTPPGPHGTPPGHT